MLRNLSVSIMGFLLRVYMDEVSHQTAGVIPTPMQPQEEASREAVMAPESSQVPEVLPSTNPERAGVVPEVSDVSEGAIREGDVWTNERESFRVDQSTPQGGIQIRFRTDAEEDAQPFSLWKIMAFFKGSASAPQGEWFFGSRDEFIQFTEEHGYRLERHGRKER